MNLKPLDLVWAKCAGYPAYPALIVDPTTSPGFTHCGIPIPVPTPEVLKQKPPKANPLLVLFFDNRRTWQWLPHRKLQQLGVDSELDSTKVHESKKGAAKKSVTEAFKRASLHLQLVNGEITEQEYFDQGKEVE